jgi:hypothetical protein
MHEEGGRGKKLVYTDPILQNGRMENRSGAVAEG